MDFIFLNKKTKKESRYSLSYAAVCDKKIGMLVNWFVGNSFKFEMMENFIPISDYL